MRKFGLIGKKLGHSFSKKYFTDKFAHEGITDASYELFELPEIAAVKELLRQEPELVGLNVTIPYKEVVIPLLDELDEAAAGIGAVNTIRISQGRTKGYNTDYLGFKATLEAFYPPAQRGPALVLGTGGAAKAVWAALDALAVPYTVVSRVPAQGRLSYAELTPALVKAHPLLVNTTPLGMAPNAGTSPPIPYEGISKGHYVYDLVYNPEQTLLLQQSAMAGAKTMNGALMLYRQADEAWKIWNP